MRSGLTIFVLGLTFLSINSNASPTPPSRLTCQLSVTGDPMSKATANLQFVSGADPLLSVKSSEKDLNFKFGQNNVAGMKVNIADGYDCKPAVASDDSGFSFDYICTQSITEIDGSKKIVDTLESKIELPKLGDGKLCESLGENSICWTINSCK